MVAHPTYGMMFDYQGISGDFARFEVVAGEMVEIVIAGVVARVGHRSCHLHNVLFADTGHE
ncbi:hypothetical protein CWO91_37590 [Bradyrhizobium genosp. SA-3]|nr:hypothetical protein CWO91_37590 [Bradyrhizobium genosp. SA-3]